MKKRRGFVTNSSSTSYICEITGHKEVFHDSEDYRDYGFCRCDNDHVFLEEFLIDAHQEYPDNKALIELLTELYNERLDFYSRCKNEPRENLFRLRLERLTLCTREELIQYYVEYLDDYADGDVREIQCPICQLAAFSQYDLVKYLEKLFGVTQQEVFDEIKKNNKRRKRLYDNEYINYVCAKFGLIGEDLLDDVKERFGTYAKFKEYIKG